MRPSYAKRKLIRSVFRFSVISPTKSVTRKHSKVAATSIHLVFQISTVPLNFQIVPVFCDFWCTLQHFSPCSPFWLLRYSHSNTTFVLIHFQCPREQLTTWNAWLISILFRSAWWADVRLFCFTRLFDSDSPRVSAQWYQKIYQMVKNLSRFQLWMSSATRGQHHLG